MNGRFTNAKDYGSHVTLQYKEGAPLWQKLTIILFVTVAAVWMTYSIVTGMGTTHKLAGGEAVYIEGVGITMNDSLSDIEMKQAFEQMLIIRREVQ
jgi:hypothetical protein